MIMAKKGNRRRLIHGQQKITVIISLLVLKINMTSDNKMTQTEKKTESSSLLISHRFVKSFPKVLFTLPRVIFISSIVQVEQVCYKIRHFTFTIHYRNQKMATRV